MNNNLENAVLILESKSEEGGGDVSLYRDVTQAERALEARDVRNNEFFGFTLGGRKLELKAAGEQVLISEGADKTDYTHIVRLHLERTVAHVPGNSAMTTERFAKYPLDELVKIIGFAR